MQLELAEASDCGRLRIVESHRVIATASDDPRPTLVELDGIGCVFRAFTAAVDRISRQVVIVEFGPHERLAQALKQTTCLQARLQLLVGQVHQPQLVLEV